MTFNDILEIQAEPISKDLYNRAKKKWDMLAKPLDSLGDFEDIVCRISAISGRLHADVEKKAIVVACADNGIVEEGVTQCGKEVTATVAKNLGLGLSSLCILAKGTGADIIPVDIGIDSDDCLTGVIDNKISRGSRNFLKEPALSEEEALAALESGMSFAAKLKEKGYGLIAGGEMGIGNTTTSTAVLSAALNLDVNSVTGRGAGLSDSGLIRKREVIRMGIEKYGFGNDNNATPQRAFDIMRCLGGFDIAFLAGLYIGSAVYHVPVILDGFISVTAAVMADMLVPGAREYMIPSHKGRSKGIDIALNSLGLEPVINGNMALGEGTGAAMMFPLIDMAVSFYNSGTTFEQEKIENYTRF